MEDLEKLLLRQSEIGEIIQADSRNFTKDPAVRKTKREYFTKRLEKLQANWEEFHANHEKLAIHEAEQEESEYFSKEYYQRLRDIYLQFKEKLNLGLASIPPSLSSNSDASTSNGLTKNTQFSINKEDTTAIKPQFNLHADSPANAEDEEEDLVKLVRKQHRTMSILTRNLQEIDDKAPESWSRVYCDLKIQLVQKLWVDITEADKMIWERCDVPPLEYTQDIYSALDSWVQATLITLHEKLESWLLTNSTGQQTHTNLKLPQITLPTFDGNYSNWTHFHDLFIQLIHSQQMSNAQKMFYLMSNLRGEAKSLVQHLPISDVNYSAAWEILTARYNNKRLLATAFFNQLLDQPNTQPHSTGTIKGLHDTTKECLLGLNNLGISTSTWDPLLVHLIIKKMDRTTHSLYEASLESPRELPTIKGLLDFLEKRFQALETLGKERSTSSHDHPGHKTYHKHLKSALTSTAWAKACLLCKRNHPLYSCKEFLSLSPANRLQFLKKNKLCINCMKSDHQLEKCTSRNCFKCGKKHNTLVHTEGGASHGSKLQSNTVKTIDNSPAAQTEIKTAVRHPGSSINTEGSNVNRGPIVLAAAQTSKAHKMHVLLGTVRVEVRSSNGELISCRAILDSGSQISFITESLARKLGLRRTSEQMCIQGIGESRQRAQHRVNLQVHSRVSDFSTHMEAFILRSITSHQPEHPIDIKTWPIPENINLADPAFNHPGSIDLLIGAEIYYEILSIGQIQLGENMPILQNTVFGWIVAGRVLADKPSYASCGICTEHEQTQDQLERFWRLEEIDSSGEEENLTVVEQRCVNHFYQHVKRNGEGRFIVKLPFLRHPSALGDSEKNALRRFLSLEKKFLRYPDVKEQYIKFMREYESLNHMKEVSSSEIDKPHYFLPHHCVTKPDSSTTKLRVVFDGSAKTSSNISLNDLLCKGPTVHDELFSILIRFRFPRFVFTADIEKMYRQIQLAEDDQIYQLILWRENPNQPVKYYKLCTVTYGLASAPFLATKCLQHLAEQQTLTHPLGSQVLKRDFYVDDVMTGSNSLTEAIEMQRQLKDLLQSAGFNLRKWCANHPQLLKAIPRDDIELELTLDDSSEACIKTLGLTWLPNCDEFCVKTTWQEPKRVNKRTVLSDIARIFDPLGFMSPVTVVAKIFIKQIWALKLDWEASLPIEMHNNWLKFREGLRKLNDIKIPRHIASGKGVKTLEIHTFADASEAAYGAATFVRAIHQDGVISVRLLCAKSKVAPNKTTTIPRLELCAAKLAAQLAHRISTDIKLPNVRSYFWTDSEVVLAWINSDSSSYLTFVANRIASIQRLSNPEQWRHVPSKENPADIVSRGIAPDKLATCNIWFYGPLFLHGPESIWPREWCKVKTDLEKRKPKVSLAAVPSRLPCISNINHGNSFKKLQRIVAYVLRFIRLTRQAERPDTEALNTRELDDALSLILLQIQLEGFQEELQELHKKNSVSKNSSLSSLTPFLDEKGIIRVGGRLENSNLEYNAKHPVLLPYAHPLTKLLMTDIHLSNLHVGPQGLLAITRQRFWPIKGKTMARSVVLQCVRCNRTQPKLMTQLMGNLPHTRVQPARPFINSGVDFCGPVYTHFKIRGKQPQKSYIVVFCCFATKAIHLEVASDLTTEGFLGALKRFIARRGHCQNLYCDNATNFVGAKNQLKELQESIFDKRSQQKINSLCQSKQINFNFIPPRAPHFGGLWEAAVKSAKLLLQRSVASASLTYEELSTVTAQIEAILNSRPITPLSSDPNDLTALTPGHFLIGEPLTALVDPQSVPQSISLIRRWDLVNHIKKEFWRRWSNEYLCELQRRYKWKQQGKNAQPGMMVLVKEDNLPPLKWQLGRIINVTKGTDGLVRVADVKTTSGILNRAIHKLAPLPINDDDEVPADHNTQEQQPSTHESDLDDIKGTPEDSEPQPKSKRARYSASSAISLLLLTSCIMPCLGDPPIQITPFDTQPGIYFENLGSAHLTSNEWHLIVYYDMENYWNELAAINKSITQLSNICKLLSDRNYCAILTRHFIRLKKELVHNNELLLPTKEKRQKRAPLNIVGNVANALFGVLDSEYAEKMAETIDNIKGNEVHLLELIKNQTSLIDSTTNVLKQHEEAQHVQLETMNNHLNEMVDHINNFTERLQQEKLAQLFSTLAIEMTLMSFNYQRAQSAILDVLIDTHHGKMNPLLLTPTQLKAELSTIKDHLPSTLRLPTGQNNLLQLYSLMKIEGTATRKYVIFKIRLPLFAFEQFELYRIVPVPVATNNTFVAIQPSADFMVINLHRDQYYPLTNQDFESCIVIAEAEYMCKQRHPIYRKGANISSCEFNFMTQLSLSTSCRITEAEKLPKWIQLFHPNEWIYSVDKPTIINVVCGTTMVQQSLKGAGILKMEKNCEIKQEFLTLRSHNVFPKITRTSYTPTENLTDLIRTDQVAQIPHLSLNYLDHQEELQAIKQQIHDLKQAEVLPNKTTSIDIHQFTLGYVAIVIGLLIAASLIYTRWKNTKKSKDEPPIPLPRKTVPPQFNIHIDDEAS